MSPRPDLGSWPHLGYTASRIERAAEKRVDADALRALEADAAARWYVRAESLSRCARPLAGLDPLFERAEAQALAPLTQTVFLGPHERAPRFALAIDPARSRRSRRATEFEVSTCARSPCAGWSMNTICRRWPRASRC
jgi:NAD+ diphosphatase